MNVCICGSQSFFDGKSTKLMREAVELLVRELKADNHTLIDGDCPNGVDAWALEEARKIGCKYALFPADWDAYGNAAGMKRNAKMRAVSDQVHAFWDGVSPGTHDMVTSTEPAKLWIYMTNGEKVVAFEPPNAVHASTKWLQGGRK